MHPQPPEYAVIAHPWGCHEHIPRARLQAQSAHCNVQDFYKQWELPKRHVMAPALVPKPLPFNAETAYHDTYVQHPLQPKFHHEAAPYQGA